MSSIEVGRANPEVLRALMERLVATYDEFATEMYEKTPGGLVYIDGMMGMHNAYKAILMDLEGRTEDREGFWRKMAVDTMAQALLGRR